MPAAATRPPPPCPSLGEHFPRDILERDNSFRWQGKGTGLLFPCRESSLAMPRLSAALEKGRGTEEGIWGGKVAGRESLTLAQLFSWLVQASLNPMVRSRLR